MSTLFDGLPAEAVWRLGWTLVHFVWEGTAIALVVALAMAALRRGSANARYAVGIAGLAAMVVAAAVTFGVLSGTQRRSAGAEAGAEARLPQDWLKGGRNARPPAGDAGTLLANDAGEASEFTPPWPPLGKGGRGAAAVQTSPPPAPMRPHDQVPSSENDTSWTRMMAARVEPYLGWMVAAWLVGMLGLSVRLLAGWGQVQRMRRRVVEQVSPQWQAVMSEVAERVRVSRPVRLLVSATALGPMTVGWLRPVVLVPVSTLTGLTPEQVRAVLAHELAHIRRYDYLVNIVQSAVETVLFYHPAVWWVSRRIRAEREHCCDDVAAEVCGGALRYARALERLETLRAGSLRLAAAARGGSLLARITRLVTPQANASSRWTGWLAGAIPLVLMAGLIAGVGLTAACGGPRSEHRQTASSVGGDTAKETAAQPAKKAAIDETTEGGSTITLQARPFTELGYVPLTQPAPAEAAYRMRHFVRLVVGEKQRTFQGKDTADKLPEMLYAVPDRAHTVLEVAYAAEGVKLAPDEETRLLFLAQEMGFEYVSYIGVHPLGSMGSPTLRVLKRGQDGRPSDETHDGKTQLTVDARFMTSSGEGEELLHEMLETKGGATRPGAVETGVMDAIQAGFFMRAVQADAHGSLLASPRLVTWNGHTALITTGTQDEINLAVGHNVPAPLPGKDAKAGPTDAAHLGIALVVKPTLDVNGRQVTLETTTNAAGELDVANGTQPYAQYGPASTALELDHTLLLRMPMLRSRVKFVAIKNDSALPQKTYEMVREPLDLKSAPEQVLYVLLTVRRAEADRATTQPAATRPAESEWQKVDSWEVKDWSLLNANMPVPHSSKSDVLLVGPRNKGGPLGVEIVHACVDDETRLVAFDQQDKPHSAEEAGRGSGAGIIQQAYRFPGLTQNEVKRLEFQRRPRDPWRAASGSPLPTAERKDRLQYERVETQNGPADPAMSGTSVRLPNGQSVELIGLTPMWVHENERQAWWKPDGSPLATEPYANPTLFGRIGYQFCLRVPKEYGCRAGAADGPRLDGSVVPYDADRKPAEGLRVGTGRFKPQANEGDWRVVLATGPWQVAARWNAEAWRSDDAAAYIAGSPAAVVLNRPIWNGRWTLLEFAHAYANDQTRLVAFDVHGEMHVGGDWNGGSGGALARRMCQFNGLDIDDVQRLEFQRRPFDLQVVFKQVALKPGHTTRPTAELYVARAPAQPSNVASTSTQPATTRPATAEERSKFRQTLEKRMRETPIPADAVRFKVPVAHLFFGENGKFEEHAGKLRWRDGDIELLLDVDRGNVHVQWEDGKKHGEATAAVVEVPSDRPDGDGTVIDVVDGLLRIQGTSPGGPIVIMGVGLQHIRMMDAKGNAIEFQSMTIRRNRPAASAPVVDE